MDGADMVVVVVVAAGEAPDVRERLRGELDRAASVVVVAADGGLDRAHALELAVDLAVGDFDSATPAARERATRSGARIVEHRPDKDATDLELALAEATAFQPDRIIVVGSACGRLDHLLALCLALAGPGLAGISVDALVGDAFIHVIRGARTLTGSRGELLTLLPVGGAARGVATSGLGYPLAGEDLEAATSRGVSNVFAGDRATVTVEQGVLLAIRPHRPDRGAS